MSNNMVDGSIRSNVTPPLSVGIYEALLEKANKDNAELADRLSGLELRSAQQLAELERERDHYKQALEKISTTIQEYKDSIVQEPSEDFIHAIKAWADKKLKEI